LYDNRLIGGIRKPDEREKGVRNLLCEAPSGPFRQKIPDPFFSLTPFSPAGPTEFFDRLDNSLQRFPAATPAEVEIRNRRWLTSAFFDLRRAGSPSEMARRPGRHHQQRAKPRTIRAPARERRLT
jgi:hypothetical protein